MGRGSISRLLHIALVVLLCSATVFGARAATAGDDEAVGRAQTLAPQQKTYPGTRKVIAPPAKPHRTYTAGAMAWHGGPVMHTSRVHLFFWDGTGGSGFTADYIAKVTRYFNDVAADSGKNTNVYSINRQYTGSPGGRAIYKVSVPKLCHTGLGCFRAWVFPDAYDNTCPTSVSYPYCVTDASMQAELAAIQTYLHVPSGVNDISFVLLPPGVNTCTGPFCYTVPSASFCAYHSSFTSGVGTVLYANQPYVPGNGGCDVFQYPTGSLADAEASVLSHEHNETITDPLGNGWFNGDGAHENGDQCAYTFDGPDTLGYGVSTGTGVLHGTPGTFWNQKIHGHKYLLQEEWSNGRFAATAVGCYQHR